MEEDRKYENECPHNSSEEDVPWGPMDLFEENVEDNESKWDSTTSLSLASASRMEGGRVGGGMLQER